MLSFTQMTKHCDAIFLCQFLVTIFSLCHFFRFFHLWFGEKGGRWQVFKGDENLAKNKGRAKALYKVVKEGGESRWTRRKTGWRPQQFSKNTAYGGRRQVPKSYEKWSRWKPTPIEGLETSQHLSEPEKVFSALEKARWVCLQQGPSDKSWLREKLLWISQRLPITYFKS